METKTKVIIFSVLSALVVVGIIIGIKGAKTTTTSVTTTGGTTTTTDNGLGSIITNVIKWF